MLCWFYYDKLIIVEETIIPPPPPRVLCLVLSLTHCVDITWLPASLLPPNWESESCISGLAGSGSAGQTGPDRTRADEVEIFLCCQPASQPAQGPTWQSGLTSDARFLVSLSPDCSPWTMLIHFSSPLSQLLNAPPILLSLTPQVSQPRPRLTCWSWAGPPSRGLTDWWLTVNNGLGRPGLADLVKLKSAKYFPGIKRNTAQCQSLSRSALAYLYFLLERLMNSDLIKTETSGGWWGGSDRTRQHFPSSLSLKSYLRSFSVEAQSHTLWSLAWNSAANKEIKFVIFRTIHSYQLCVQGHFQQTDQHHINTILKLE